MPPTTKRTITIEIKFIGQEDLDFEVLLESMRGGVGGGSVSPYSAMNYLLFRAYEAAKQLSGASHPKLVLIAIDDMAYSRFDTQLGGGWINWAKAEFWKAGRDWNEFLASQRAKYPDIEADLASTLRELDELWIAVRRAGLVYAREHVIRFGDGGSPQGRASG
jgi:hypothetical protein